MPLWTVRGRSDPALPHLKQAIVAEAVRRHRASRFVETGTYRGDTLASVAPLVDRAVSIELDPTLAALARERFRTRRNVEILTGDSSSELPRIVATLGGPGLFWLDGHFSGGATADSGSCPVLAELGAILDSPYDHFILIDDIRLFDGTDGYPELGELRAVLAARRPDWAFVVEDDIARAHVDHATASD